MRRTEIIHELTKRGYKAQKQNILKNGVTFKAITIYNEEGLGVVIYTEALIKEAELYGKSLDDIVNNVILKWLMVLILKLMVLHMVLTLLKIVLYLQRE